MARKPTDIVQPKVRMRESLRRKLEVAAKKMARTLNAEIVARLEESFDRESLLDIRERLIRLEGTVASHPTFMATIAKEPDDK